MGDSRSLSLWRAVAQIFTVAQYAPPSNWVEPVRRWATQFSPNITSDEFVGRLDKAVAQLPAEPRDAADLALRVIDQDVIQLKRLFWALQWARCGFQVVRVERADWAAAAATSRFSPEVIGELRLPWPAFVIVVPRDAGLVVPDDTMVEGGPLDVVMVSQSSNREENQNIQMLVRGGHQLLYRGTSPDRLCGDALPLELEFPEKTGAMELTSDDDRCLRVVGALTASTVLELCSYWPSHGEGSGARGYRSQRRGSGIMEVVLGRPVKVDLRQQLGAYLRGEVDRVTTARTLVRFHWKMQPCGKAFSERRLTWIEPYWRGDENAPMVVRDHVL